MIAKIKVKELRFLFDPELTQCYVLLECDEPISGVNGWRHKTFSFSQSVSDINAMILQGEENFLLWPQDAP